MGKTILFFGEDSKVHMEDEKWEICLRKIKFITKTVWLE